MSALDTDEQCDACGSLLLALLPKQQPVMPGVTGPPDKALVFHDLADPMADSAVYLGYDDKVVRARMNPAPFVMVHNGFKGDISIVLKQWGDWAEDA